MSSEGNDKRTEKQLFHGKNSCFMDVEVCDLVAGGVCWKHQDSSVMQVLGVQLILWVYA